MCISNFYWTRLFECLLNTLNSKLNSLYVSILKTSSLLPLYYTPEKGTTTYPVAKGVIISSYLLILQIKSIIESQPPKYTSNVFPSFHPHTTILNQTIAHLCLIQQQPSDGFPFLHSFFNIVSHDVRARVIFQKCKSVYVSY